VSLVLALFLITALTAAQDAPQRRLPFDQDLAVKKELGSERHITIAYHNGPVMVAPAHLYVVYYGNFTTTQHRILDNFLQNVGGSPAFNVNTEYYNYLGKYVQNILTYSPATRSVFQQQQQHRTCHPQAANETPILPEFRLGPQL
jgi:hypothetical protein